MEPPGYCFPEISRTVEERLGKRFASPPVFKRQAPGSTDGVCRWSDTKARRWPEQAAVDLEQEAYCRGFSDGEKSGLEQGRRAEREGVSGRLEKTLKSLEKMFADLQHLQKKDGRNIERQTVRLALEVARKIVGREVQTDGEAVSQLIRRALGRLEHAERITVRMHPEDMQRLAEFAPGMLAEMTGAHRVHFEGDAAISCGGCRIESDSGDIDARLERRFKDVEAAFQAEWNQQGADPG